MYNPKPTLGDGSIGSALPLKRYKRRPRKYELDGNASPILPPSSFVHSAVITRSQKQVRVHPHGTVEKKQLASPGAAPPEGINMNVLSKAIPEDFVERKEGREKKGGLDATISLAGTEFQELGSIGLDLPIKRNRGRPRSCELEVTASSVLPPSSFVRSGVITRSQKRVTGFPRGTVKPQPLASPEIPPHGINKNAPSKAISEESEEKGGGRQRKSGIDAIASSSRTILKKPDSIRLTLLVKRKRRKPWRYELDQTASLTLSPSSSANLGVITRSMKQGTGSQHDILKMQQCASMEIPSKGINMNALSGAISDDSVEKKRLTQLKGGACATVPLLGTILDDPGSEKKHLLASLSMSLSPQRTKSAPSKATSKEPVRKKGARSQICRHLAEIEAEELGTGKKQSLICPAISPQDVNVSAPSKAISEEPIKRKWARSQKCRLDEAASLAGIEAEEPRTRKKQPLDSPAMSPQHINVGAPSKAISGEHTKKKQATTQKCRPDATLPLDGTVAEEPGTGKKRSLASLGTRTSSCKRDRGDCPRNEKKHQVASIRYSPQCANTSVPFDVDNVTASSSPSKLSPSPSAVISRQNQGRCCSLRTRKEQHRLDTNEFDHYFQKLWENLSEDKKASFMYVDCLWFYLYMKAKFKKNVLKWIKKQHFFSKKYVIIPIAFRNHWSLLIFCNFTDGNLLVTKTPCMLLLDSLHETDPRRQLEQDIRRFVMDIYKSEGRLETKDAIYKIPLLVPKVPQQKDGDKCGYFVLYYIKLFMERAPKNFSMEGYPFFMKENWFTFKDLDHFCQNLIRM